MSLMLVNPRKRKATRSAAQKAATRRMIAARKGTSRKRRTTAKRRSNPIRSRVRHIHHAAKRRARRRNPIGSTSGMMGMLMNGLKGAGGAVVVNAVTNYLPAVAVTGKMVYASRAVLAIALGTFGRKVLGAHARPMAEGALAVNFHDLINNVAGASLPGSNLHGVGEYMQVSGATIRELPQASGGTYVDTELNGVAEYMQTY